MFFAHYFNSNDFHFATYCRIQSQTFFMTILFVEALFDSTFIEVAPQTLLAIIFGRSFRPSDSAANIGKLERKQCQVSSDKYNFLWTFLHLIELLNVFHGWCTYTIWDRMPKWHDIISIRTELHSRSHYLWRKSFENSLWHYIIYSLNEIWRICAFVFLRNVELSIKITHNLMHWIQTIGKLI